MLNLAIVSLYLGVAGASAPGAELAVLPLHTSTMDAPTREALTSVLASVVQKAAPWSVISSADLDAILELEKSKDLLGCDGVACARDLAGALGVRWVLATSGDVLGDRVVFTTALIDARASVVERRETRAAKNDPAAYLEAIRAAVEATFAPARASAPEHPANVILGAVSRVAFSPSIDPGNHGPHDHASGGLVAAELSLRHSEFLEVSGRLGGAFDGTLWSFERQVAGVIGVGERAVFSPVAASPVRVVAALDADFFASASSHLDTLATVGLRYRALELRLGGGVRVMGQAETGAGPGPRVIPLFAVEAGARLPSSVP